MLDFIGHKSFPAFDRLTGTSVLSIHQAPEIVLEVQNLQMQMLWRWGMSEWQMYMNENPLIIYITNELICYKATIALCNEEQYSYLIYLVNLI